MLYEIIWIEEQDELIDGARCQYFLVLLLEIKILNISNQKPEITLRTL